METQEQLEAKSRAFWRWKNKRPPVVTKESWPETYEAFRRYKSRKFERRKLKVKMEKQKRLSSSAKPVNSESDKKPVSTDSPTKKAQPNPVTAVPVSSPRPSTPVASPEVDEEKKQLEEELRKTLRNLLKTWGNWDSISKALSYQTSCLSDN